MFAVACSNSHVNLVDSRIVAETQVHATEISRVELKKNKCKWCDSLTTGNYKILGVEELPLYESYNIMGYTCQCGERVEVLRAARQTGFEIPMSVTVQCSKGHSRTILNQEFLSLDSWTEQTQ